jgi:hypothetical protein
MTKTSMTKTMRILGVASLLMTGAATAMAQGGDAGGVSSKAVTGTQTGSQQTNTPATGTATSARPPRPHRTTRTVGPTGSTQPHAANSTRGSAADHAPQTP